VYMVRARHLPESTCIRIQLCSLVPSSFRQMCPKGTPAPDSAGALALSSRAALANALSFWQEYKTNACIEASERIQKKPLCLALQLQALWRLVALHISRDRRCYM